MTTRRVALVACALICARAAGVAAQARPWTLADVLARARTHAPTVVSARLTTREVAGRLPGAARRLATSPELDVQAGYRNGSDGDFADVQVGVMQALEPGARRDARVAAVSAAVEESAAREAESARTAMSLAAVAYYRVLHADRRLRLLDEAQALTARILDIADRRFRAGDVAVLDVNLARAATARARAQRASAQALRTEAEGHLRQVLALEDPLTIDGTLARPGPIDLAAGLDEALRRPELRALEAAAREAEAGERLGIALGKAAFGLGARYSREEGDQVFLGSLTVAWPRTANGLDLRTTSRARVSRLRAELDLARLRIRQDVKVAFEAFERRLSALDALQTDALPGLEENEALATRSYEVGQMSLADLLLVRRELLDTRLDHLDALLEAVQARVAFDAAAGVLR